MYTQSGGDVPRSKEVKRIPKNRDEQNHKHLPTIPLRVEHLVVAQFNTVYIPSPNTRTEEVHNQAIIYKENEK